MSASRLTTLPWKSGAPSRYLMKFEPMKPAPPVTRTHGKLSHAPAPRVVALEPFDKPRDARHPARSKASSRNRAGGRTRPPPLRARRLAASGTRRRFAFLPKPRSSADDEVGQGLGPAVADVVDPERRGGKSRDPGARVPLRVRRRGPVHDPSHGLHHVIDIREVPGHLSRVEELDGLSRPRLPGQTCSRPCRASPRGRTR